MISISAALSLILLIIFSVLILYFAVRAKDHRIPSLRPIPAFDALKKQVAESIEAGKQVHLAVGTGRITDATTADTLMGIETLSYIAAKTAPAKTSPVVTAADPVVAMLAQHVVGNSFEHDADAIAATAPNVRWVSPEPAAYAAGVMGIVAQENIHSNVMVGKFGDEFLLMSESAQQQKNPVPTIAASSDPNVLPYVYATTDHGILGEEMFAAGAYLAEKPTHIGSVLAQDAIRWGVSIVIFGGVILKAFGVW